MGDLRCLLVDGGHHDRVRVAQGVDRDARGQVQVLPAVRVPDPGAVSALQEKGLARVGAEHPTRVQLPDDLGGHAWLCWGVSSSSEREWKMR